MLYDETIFGTSTFIHGFIRAFKEQGVLLLAKGTAHVVQKDGTIHVIDKMGDRQFVEGHFIQLLHRAPKTHFVKAWIIMDELTNEVVEEFSEENMRWLPLDADHAELMLERFNLAVEKMFVIREARQISNSIGPLNFSACVQKFL